MTDRPWGLPIRSIPRWPDGMPRMGEILADARVGEVEVRTWNIATARMYGEGYRARTVPPGKYAQLFVHVPPSLANLHHESPTLTVMSDLPIEREDHAEVYARAHGDVLVAGLGLGMIALALATKQSVRTVQVIELGEAVPELVLAHLRRYNCWRRKVRVLMGDATRMRDPWAQRLLPTRFDTIWLDIWLTLSGGYLRQYNRMLREYRQWLTPGGYIGAWAYDWVKRDAQTLRKKKAEAKLVRQLPNAKEVRTYETEKR